MHLYWSTFKMLLTAPFESMSLVWGIVPLYFGLFLNELTTPKANFRTAVQTGFSFLWAVAQWIYPYFIPTRKSYGSLEAVNIVVTLLVLAFGLAALLSGLRKRFPKNGRFLGHTRFANYFMITIFPIQAHYLGWTFTRLVAIILFAVPTWLILHFGLMPLRNRF